MDGRKGNLVEMKTPTDWDIMDACNSFVVELARLAKLASLPNNAALRGFKSEKPWHLAVWLSPSVNWAHAFLARLKDGLSPASQAMTDAIQTYNRYQKHDRSGEEQRAVQDTDYNVYRHGLENSLCTGCFDFVVNPYFSFWHTVHAMLGVLGDLLQKSFKKVDTSGALPEGTVAYDLYVKGGEDDNQRIGRLFLELARRLPAGGYKARSEEPWGGKTPAYPEVEMLQSV